MLKTNLTTQNVKQMSSWYKDLAKPKVELQINHLLATIISISLNQVNWTNKQTGNRRHNSNCRLSKVNDNLNPYKQSWQFT